jgi:hypothetical protein
MKHPWKYLSALAVGAILTTPAQAIPITFDFSGLVVQRSTLDSTGAQTDHADDVGTPWSAQFVMETDLFGPMQSSTDQFGTIMRFTGAPGAVTTSLTIGGISIDAARYNTDSSNIFAADSTQWVEVPGGWTLRPDQWGVNFRSREVTAQGIVADADLQMGFTDFFNFAEQTGGTELFDLDDVTSALSFASLPLSDPRTFRDVEYSFANYSCDLGCTFTDYDFWSLGVASVTRTVGATAVPEPGTLALLLASLGGAFALRRRRAV